MKQILIKGLKTSAWILIGTGYIMATTYGAALLSLTVKKKLLN